MVEGSDCHPESPGFSQMETSRDFSVNFPHFPHHPFQTRLRRHFCRQKQSCRGSAAGKNSANTTISTTSLKCGHMHLRQPPPLPPSMNTQVCNQEMQTGANSRLLQQVLKLAALTTPTAHTVPASLIAAPPKDEGVTPQEFSGLPECLG